MKVREIMTNDDVSAAMATMRRARVRQLPVVSDGGKIESIVALNDLVLPASRKRLEIDYDEVMNTVQAVSEHRGRKPAEPEKLKFPPIPVAVA
jgi:CBS-domain-containing membrane protein